MSSCVSPKVDSVWTFHPCSPAPLQPECIVDPALMYRLITSIIKQSAGSLSQLIGSSITACNQSHLFLLSAPLSHTHRGENCWAQKPPERLSVNMYSKTYLTTVFIDILPTLSPKWYFNHHALKSQCRIFRWKQQTFFKLCFSMISEQSKTLGWFLNKAKLQTHVVNNVLTAL